MCGVVGLRLKDQALYPVLGELVVPMLDVLASRGPDSTGVAIYRHDAGPVELRRRGRDAVVVAGLDADHGPGLLAGLDPSVRLFGYGAAMEVYKDVGPAGEVCARYGIADMAGYQAIGHTRMATESAVTTGHSHP